MGSINCCRCTGLVSESSWVGQNGSTTPQDGGSISLLGNRGETEYKNKKANWTM